MYTVLNDGIRSIWMICWWRTYVKIDIPREPCYVRCKSGFRGGDGEKARVTQLFFLYKAKNILLHENLKNLQFSICNL